MSGTTLFGADDTAAGGRVRTVKAISLWQPWASLWACGRKRFETRHWDTLHRGPIAIHAAKRVVTDLDPELAEIVIDEFGGHWAMDLPRGALLATGRLVACHPVANLIVPAEEWAQGNFGPGRYAWELAGLRPLARAVPWRGRQGLFEVPAQLVEEAGAL